MVALSSAVAQFFDPAHESVLPEVASDEELATANSMIAISSFGSTAIGFAASGLIASRFAIEWAFYIDAITFLLSALCISLIHVQPLEVEGETNVRAVVHNLREGAQFLFTNDILRSVLLVGTFYVVSVGLWNSLLLPFALRALNATEFEYRLQEGLTSVGFVIGSLVMAKFAERLREGQWLVISMIGMMIAGIFYGLSQSISVAISLVMVSGFVNASYGISRRLLLQRNTPREVRGRVNIAWFVTRDVVLLIGMGLAGLADLIDVRVMIIDSQIFLIVPAFFSRNPTRDWTTSIRMEASHPVAAGCHGCSRIRNGPGCHPGGFRSVSDPSACFCCIESRRPIESGCPNTGLSSSRGYCYPAQRGDQRCSLLRHRWANGSWLG